MTSSLADLTPVQLVYLPARHDRACSIALYLNHTLDTHADGTVSPQHHSRLHVDCMG